jgi:hypothetical protein
LLRFFLRRRGLLGGTLLSVVREREGKHRQACEQSESRGVPWASHDVKV